MLLIEIKSIFHKELDPLYAKEEVDSFFHRMVEHYLKLERFILVMQPELALTKTEEQPLFEGLARLKNEEPLQYILGETHFRDITLKVNEHVLIPRPETEELVEWILGTERSRSVVSTSLNDPLKILDIGTGSGCIAIALAKAIPNAEVHAIDISEKAIQVAKENAELNGVEVHFIKADILNSEFRIQNSEFDIIVSNPPYVRESEKFEIHNNVKKHEPESALFVPDDDPLRFYKAILQFSEQNLKPKGSLFLEINQYLAEESQQLLVDNHFQEVELRKDIFGNFRMLKAKNVPLRGL